LTERVAPGFEAVAEEFLNNLHERGELGAAFAVVRDGELIVDLWAGIADPGPPARAWTADTLVPIFSGAKGLVAACLLILIDRGELELEAPVAAYWPEFAAAGKGDLTVRQVVTHTAGVPGLVTPVAFRDLPDGGRMAALLAAQPRFVDPRAARTYHLLTYGWLCGELIQRIDGRSVGRFFAEEVAVPLGLELYIGLPEELSPRVARLELAPGWGSARVFDPDVVEHDALLRSVWANPPAWTRESFPWNDEAIHRAEIPAVGAIGTARAIARLYAGLDRLISAPVLRLGRTALEHRHDPLTDQPQAFGVGFELQTESRPLGPPADAFGHTGAGGSVHGAWPAQRIGFSYAMNLMRDDAGDVRASALLDALATSAAGRRRLREGSGPTGGPRRGGPRPRPPAAWSP